MLSEIIKDKKVVIYGLSTETERTLQEWGGRYEVLGLLDGFKSSGEQFGYPILDIKDVVSRKDVIVIVVARPGSCRAIVKRIGDLCRENGIEVFDVRGNDLLSDSKVVYDFSSVKGYTKKDLSEAVRNVKAVSFDLFNTLIVRKISSFEGLLELVGIHLDESGIRIPDFVKKRIGAEKKLSFNRAPKLEEIYSELLKDESNIKTSAKELAEAEFDIDISLIEARRDVVEILNDLVKQKGSVYITSDSYYTKEQILKILNKVGVKPVSDVLVSCEYDTSKTGELFDRLIDVSGERNILHIGDDIVSDIEAAKRHGLKTFMLYASIDLFELAGGLRLKEETNSLSDRIRVGMFIANLFNSPFQFEEESKKICVKEPNDIGFLFCAPMLMDFTKWFEEESKAYGCTNRFLCARDGYLLKKLYDIMYSNQKVSYFYTSRISAIRAGVENAKDIEYVDSMKFSGKCEDNLKTRFGIDAETLNESDVDKDKDGLLKYTKAILESAKVKKENNLKYIENIGVCEGCVAFFDLVAKGTSQLYLQKMIDNPIKGLYFLQLEPEFMKDKNLDIKPFYSEEERETSAVFNNYYILETILTSPEASIEEFDSAGKPVFSEETRSDENIDCIMKIQGGIVEYVKKYMEICPEKARKINKALDEAFLTLIHNLEIRDEGFLSLALDDPFFNRRTGMEDIL
ncbi:MAG: HAD hydrolase-like protein [Lachnospiraceae bacterium]|nr:HAD hydrolase-like protein [Lachnospiraceae bacterium]